MGNVHLVTGYKGEAHVTAADQGAFNAAVFGDGQYVLERGNQLAASATTNNNIRVLDGEIMMQGRHIRINPDEYVDLTINNGAQDMYRNDLIVARYTRTASTGVEDCNLVVIEGAASDSAASDPAYTSGDILGGNALQNDMPLYRVSIDGINISAVTKLFTTIGGIDSDIPSSKLPTVPISKGGTGATTASTALANLGAAPAGLISASYTAASDAEIDAALNTELNEMSENTAHHISLHVSQGGLSLEGGAYDVFVYKLSDDYAFARATKYGMSSPRLIIRERSKSGGTWYSWYNPSDHQMEYGEREQIPSGANLNDYTSIGNYAVSQSSIATGISNCPTTNAFILNVFSSIGDDTKTPASGSTGYFYYIQELIDINANRWIRYCNYLGSYWTYGNWAKIITSAGGTMTGSLITTGHVLSQKTTDDTVYATRIYNDSSNNSCLVRTVNGTTKNFIALEDDVIITDKPLKLSTASYGSTLPSTGVAGQLFFKI